MSKLIAKIERVAKSADEFALLAGIVDHPLDDTAKLVYADWLEERDDSRGPMLRSFVQAYKRGKALPNLANVPAAWADLTGLTIHEKLVQSKMKKWREKLLPLARPALRIEATKANFDDPPHSPDRLGTTRLGGDPDLPKGAPYPLGSDGSLLHFLGQFNLADLKRTIAGRAFPDSGLLSIFRPQAEHGSCYPTKGDMPRLVQFIPDGTKLVRTTLPDDDPDDPPAPFRPGLKLIETLRLPGEYRHWPGVDMEYEDASKLDAVFPTNLGGTIFQLLGHATHGNTGEEPIKDRPDWHQLILVPYFEGPDYGVTDMSLSYHLPAADLKAGRFDRLEATFG